MRVEIEVAPATREWSNDDALQQRIGARAREVLMNEFEGGEDHLWRELGVRSTGEKAPADDQSRVILRIVVLVEKRNHHDHVEGDNTGEVRECAADDQKVQHDSGNSTEHGHPVGHGVVLNSEMAKLSQNLESTGDALSESCLLREAEHGIAHEMSEDAQFLQASFGNPHLASEYRPRLRARNPVKDIAPRTVFSTEHGLRISAKTHLMAGLLILIMVMCIRRAY